MTAKPTLKAAQRLVARAHALLATGRPEDMRTARELTQLAIALRDEAVARLREEACPVCGENWQEVER